MTGAGNLAIDHKIVAATMFNILKTAVDFGADYSTEFTAPINGQRTSSVLVRTKPSLSLSDVPAVRDGLLARTSITGGSVEVHLKDDKYFKVAVDDQGVLPGQVETEIGTAGAEAIASYGNAELLETLQSVGTAVPFVFDADTTAQEVWTALLAQKTAYTKAGYTNSVILYIDAEVWNTLIGGIASLGTAVNAQERAAQLLGVDKVYEVNLTEAHAVFAHRGSVAQAKVLSGIRSAQEDFDSIVEGRIKVGTNVLDPGAVRVLA
jgi:hypothetical protein